MSLISQLKKITKDPAVVPLKILQLSSKHIKNDKKYLSARFRLKHHKKMNWDNPKSFCEKVNCLKLWSKDKGFEKFVDKYEVREYVKNTIGEEYLIPVYGVWDSFDEIDFDKLPKQYVLKTTHDSGGVIIVRDKLPANAKQFLENRLKHNFFWLTREYPYLKVKPRIIAEKYMEDESGWELKDYKIFCFNGEPKILFLASDRFKKKGEKAKFDYFDLNLNRLPFYSKGHKSKYLPGEKHAPIDGFDRMIELAGKLSQGFPFIRIDFYNINGKIYFGEMTFFHDGADVSFLPYEYELKMGDMISLP